jgi:dTDP-4-amino-4,6-dideoxygalactose transaminase
LDDHEIAMLNSPFSPWPSFSQEEADAVRRILLTNRVNYWTGQECREFETEFAAWAGSKYAVALMNGTVALDVALRVLGIGPGDEVIVTPRTFIASVSSIVLAGAKPVFADVSADSQNIAVENIQAVLTCRTRAIVCVHLAGWPCDMEGIMSLADMHGLYVVEDCAQAHGALYQGETRRFYWSCWCMVVLSG